MSLHAYGYETGTETKERFVSQPASKKSSEEWVESRFGKIKINRENSVYFPRGILGFPENLDFCLADFPSEKMEQFKVLQCLNDKELAFVVLPVQMQNQLIEQQDIDEATEILGIDKQNLAILLIVSVHRKASSVSLSVNVRAPIMVDTAQKLAAQFVFPNNKYEIRHFISGG